MAVREKIKQKTLVKREVSSPARRGGAEETRSPGRAEQPPLGSIWSPKAPAAAACFLLLKLRTCCCRLCPHDPSHPPTLFGPSKLQQVPVSRDPDHLAWSSMPSSLVELPSHPVPGLPEDWTHSHFHNPICVDGNCAVHGCGTSS